MSGKVRPWSQKLARHRRQPTNRPCHQTLPLRRRSLRRRPLNPMCRTIRSSHPSRPVVSRSTHSTTRVRTCSSGSGLHGEAVAYVKPLRSQRHRRSTAIRSPSSGLPVATARMPFGTSSSNAACQRSPTSTTKISRSGATSKSPTSQRGFSSTATERVKSSSVNLDSMASPKLSRR